MITVPPDPPELSEAIELAIDIALELDERLRGLALDYESERYFEHPNVQWQMKLIRQYNKLRKLTEARSKRA